ncbi:MAG TPA: hypothetical protein VLI93_00580 [Acetobacteraceae bacterium]|nr:hypothetical protein [Acetobacteraceae bacterium]
MLAIGCFIPVLLLVAGGAVGLFIGGNAAGLWSAAVGFVLGCILLIALLWGYERVTNR